MILKQIPIILRGGPHSPTIPAGGGGGGKITFNDPATGTNGNPPNPAIWTPDQSGWQYNGLGQYYFNGASYSFLVANCTNGDNTLQADIDTGPFAFSDPTFAIRYVDGNNWVVLFLNDGSGHWEIEQMVAGTPTTLANGGSIGTGNRTYTVSIANVGNVLTATFSGGASNNGSFGFTTSTHSTATKVAIAGNTGKPDLLWDNIILS